MALQSEAASPVVGEAHKDTYDGDTKSEDNDTEDEEDLEEGEILDSGNEGDEEDTAPLPTSTSTSPSQPAKEESNCPLKKFQEIVESAENSLKNQMPSSEEAEKEWANESNHNKFKRKYVDHDISGEAFDEENKEKESGWYKRLSRKKQSLQDEPLDYRKELKLYAGSPGSSPEREKKSTRKRIKTAASILKAKARKAAARRAKAHADRKAGIVKKIIVRKPCKYFLEGHCSKGGDCPFQHIKPGRDRKRELCRYYLTGHCSKGRQCTFMHDEFPCKFFHTGAKCYSGDSCRFSHKPLTEETEQLLKECLKGYHDDHHEPRKRQKSQSPEPPPPPTLAKKRPCLLGSPPRHIREAEETKRWQEEMIYLQREKSADFHIRLSPLKKFSSPSKFVKPNFYVDTMQSSPPNQRTHQSNPFQEDPVLPASMAFQIDSTPCPQKLEDEDLRQPLDWTNIQALVDSMNGPKDQPSGDNEEERKFSDGGNSDSRFRYPEADTSMSDTGDNSNSKDDGHRGRSPSPQDTRTLSPTENQPSSRSSSPPDNREQTASPNPIVIPSHLPRKQQELMLRIQRHQRTKAADDNNNNNNTDVSEKNEADNIVPKTAEVNTPNREDDYENKGWSSSDDDDDDVDRPLTDVLKKLRQTPPPKPKEVPALNVQKPPLDLNVMLSSIIQKANENKSNPLYQEQGKFWQNILSGTMLPTKSHNIPTSTNTIPMVPPLREGKRRVLLPDPKPIVEKPPPESRDPRLKNRDPRTAVPKAITPSLPVIPSTVPQILPMEAITSNSLPSQHRDIPVPSHTAAIVVDGLKANIPYKLHSVTCMPLDYSCYIQASHSDPKLLNDPRLRKHMAQEGTNQATVVEAEQEPKHATLPDLPLFCNFTLPVQENNNPPSQLPPDVPRLPELKLPPPQVSQVNDPRTRRRPSAGNSPPLTPAAAETVVTAAPPTIGSHLPRAIVDPRMAKLHKPLDPRRLRVATEQSSKTSLASRTQQPATLVANTTNLAIQDSSTIPKVEPTEVDDGSDKKSEPAKKNKAVHRNRKTSMDYASPLNSCDDSSSGTLNYNSYNQRPKNRLRSSAVEVPLPNETLPTPSSLVNALMPDFSTSDSSNLDCDSLDASASLKDKFKTIDPTASPFC